MVRGFRNLADADLDVPREGWVLVGPNGHGKTSVLEAALYCQVFRSFRAAADRELVTFGADGFHLSVALEAEGDAPPGRPGAAAERDCVAAGYDARTRQKRITVGGAPAGRTADAIGVVRGVVMSPGDVALVAGGPRERRRFLDVLLALTVPGYLDALERYRRALRHRARATRAELPTWDRMLAERGVALVDARRAWTAAWAGRYAELCASLGERAAPELAYRPNVEGGADAIFEALERRRARDAMTGHAGAGPHRDELRLLLDGRELRVYGSAGQQRTAAIALRLVEAETLHGATGRAVLLGLDDAFAELDQERGTRLAGLALAAARAGYQIVAAVPKAGDVPRELADLPMRTIREGRLT